MDRRAYFADLTVPLAGLICLYSAVAWAIHQRYDLAGPRGREYSLYVDRSTPPKPEQAAQSTSEALNSKSAH